MGGNLAKRKVQLSPLRLKHGEPEGAEGQREGLEGLPRAVACCQHGGVRGLSRRAAWSWRGDTKPFKRSLGLSIILEESGT